MKTFVLLAFLALACNQTNRYAYAPVSTTSAELDGRPAAVVAVPADAPRGKMAVTSLGIASVSPPSALARRPFTALYLRVTLTNDGDEPWLMDEAMQRVQLDEHGQSSASFTQTLTGERPPVLTVAPHRSVTADLAFPLGKSDASDVSRFAFAWSLRIGARDVAGEVPFERRTEEMPLADIPPLEPARPSYRYPERTRQDPTDPLVPCIP